MSSFFRKIHRNHLTAIGFYIILFIILIAIFGPFFDKHSYNEQNLADFLKPPVWAGGTWEYPFGTDQLGRCLLSRMLYGARISLLIGISAVFVSGLFGSLIGVFCGYYGGKIDSVLMGLADIQLSFPAILLAIAIMSMLGQSVVNLVVVLAFVNWVQYARVARGRTMSVIQNEFIEASHSIGNSDFKIIFQHIIPNILPSILTIATINVSAMILSEAGLSYLGLGIRPPMPTWGSILNDGRQVYVLAPWNAILPGIAITLTVFGINLLGDGLSENEK